MDASLHITGTLIWYYFICHREVWLMARQINPDEDNPNVDLGRFIQEQTYPREKKKSAWATSSLILYIKVRTGWLSAK